jgi:uncharacterized membrane protein
MGDGGVPDGQQHAYDIASDAVGGDRVNDKKSGPARETFTTPKALTMLLGLVTGGAAGTAMGLQAGLIGAIVGGLLGAAAGATAGLYIWY